MIAYKQGFTLLEVAMVLGVLALITLGVIKGQSLIETSKINNLIKEFYYYEYAIQTHMASRRKLPGSFQSGYNDRWDEERFWQDLRKEGLIEGDPSDGTSPVHMLGDPTKHTFDVYQRSDIGEIVLCAKEVGIKYVKAIDQKIDDGDVSQNSGRIFARNYSPWRGDDSKTFVWLCYVVTNKQALRL